MPAPHAATSDGPLTLDDVKDRLDTIMASIADVERELKECAASSTSATESAESRALRIRQVHVKLSEYVHALKVAHGELVNGGIVKKGIWEGDGRGGGAEAPVGEAPAGTQVEIPVEVIEALDQGKNPDDVMRYIFGSVLKRGQDVKGKEQAMRAFKAAAGDGGERDALE